MEGGGNFEWEYFVVQKWDFETEISRRREFVRPRCGSKSVQDVVETVQDVVV